MKEMEKFCKTKKNMFLPIREGLTGALREMQVLKERMKRHDRYIEHFEYHLRDKLVQRIKEARPATKVSWKRVPKLSLSPRRGLFRILVSG